jgi:hypothetical protein
MNFPDVPFDESLFESNSMMHAYWSRSTDRQYNIPDARLEEFDDSQDLRLRSADLLEATAAAEAAAAAEQAEAEQAEAAQAAEITGPEIMKAREVARRTALGDAIVKPKSVTEQYYLIFIIVAVMIGIAVFKFQFLGPPSKSRRT